MSLLLLLRSPPPAAVTGTAATSQAQTIAADGAFTAIGVTGTAVTSQAQATSGAGAASVASVSGVGATSQAQTIEGTGTATVQPVSGVLSSSQAQTALLTGDASPAAVSGVGSTAQAQTVASSGSFAGASNVTGVASTSQAQTSSGVGEVTGGAAAPSFDGGFVMRTRKVYVKRGKRYFIFNNNEEADSYLAAEAAIETAKKSSRGAAKRVMKAFKVVKPEIADEPKLEELSDLIAKFNVNYDLIQLQKNNDIEALYQVQARLYAMQQDEDDIEILLLSI